MKRKIALVLTSLLILTALLTTLYFTAPATSPSPSPEGVYHWKIELAQEKCNAFILGYLTHNNVSIPGTEFELWCNCTGAVFWKVATEFTPTDIFFWKYIDWDKDGIYEFVEPVFGYLEEPGEGHRWYHHQEHLELVLVPIDPPLINLTSPICTTLQEPIPPYRTYHLSSWNDTGWPYGNLSYCDQVDLTPTDPPGPVDWWHVQEVSVDHLVLRKTVVVEVHEQPYDPDDPYFYWQLMIKQHGLEANWTGFLAIYGDPILGTYFDIYCNRTLQCQVVRTPYCTVPNVIDSELLINGMPPPIQIWETITQFPWTYVYLAGPGVNATLELTEVQMHHYKTMGGRVNTAGQLGGYLPPPVALWDLDGWLAYDGAPHNRDPKLQPVRYCQNITFTQPDPITGIVKIGVPAESHVGFEHEWYSNDTKGWFRAKIVYEDQACGWIFTGTGKDPILGSVDLLTYNNYSGVYTYGPDGVAKTADDELLAGPLPGGESAGAGPPIGPCLQQLRGPDGIPGTGDDPIGRGDPDGPNPPGSSILYTPAKLVVWWTSEGLPEWYSFLTAPFPGLLTTGTSTDTVMEPASWINGNTSTLSGQPWEYFAGLDHPSQQVPWKHEDCNAYVHYAAVWSVCQTWTPLGYLDLLYEVAEKKVREDHVIADMNCDEKVDDEEKKAWEKAYPSEDESTGPDKKPFTDDDKKYADPNYDPTVDFAPPYGIIDLADLIAIFEDIPCVYPVTWKWLDAETPPNEVWLLALVKIGGCCLAVQNFDFDGSLGQISFNITSATPGSCTVTIPKLLMDGAFQVLIDDALVPSILGWNSTHTGIWFNHTIGTHNVKIIGEIVTRIRSLDLETIADVNGDGVVDLYDLVKLGVVYGWKEAP